MTTEISNLIAYLAELYAQRDADALRKAELKDSLLTPEQRTEMAAIDLEFAGPEGVLAEIITDVEGAVKTAVAQHGASITAAGYRAEYRKPSVTWDSARLEGFAVTYPDILAFRKVGQPSVAIKAVKK